MHEIGSEPGPRHTCTKNNYVKLTAGERETKLLANDKTWSRRVERVPLRLCHYLGDEKGLRGGMAAEIYGAMRPKKLWGLQ
jgi:hypothetical protein